LILVSRALSWKSTLASLLERALLYDNIGRIAQARRSKAKSSLHGVVEGRAAKRNRACTAENKAYIGVRELRTIMRNRAVSTDNDAVILLENVSKAYTVGVPALNDVNLHINKGEFVFIVGDSGSGKSTLIKLLLRELLPTSGRVIVNGTDVARLKRKSIPKFRRSLGVVFQDFRLLKDRNVYENVAFAQRIIQMPNREIRKNVPSILSTVGLAGKYKARPKQLSGGEQQRVALARALVNKPKILLADEPTGNLDPKNSWEIMNLLEKINNNGTTVLVVTHNREIVNSMRKRVITMKKGIIVSDEEEGGYIDED